MWNARLDEAQPWMKTPRRNRNNLRYADDTTLMAESEEELKSLLLKVKEENEEAGLKLLLLLSHFSRGQLCDPIDDSPTGSSVLWILQARILEWVAIFFSQLKTRHSKNEDHGIWSHGIWSHHFMENTWGNDGNRTDFLFLDSKITADGDCSHEIKRHLLLGRNAVTNPDSILKSRDITLPIKVCLIKDVFFPVVMYGWESWTIKKDERWRTDAFKLWRWRRLLCVPWTAWRSIQSILKESILNIHWKD